MIDCIILGGEMRKYGDRSLGSIIINISSDEFDKVKISQ